MVAPDGRLLKLPPEVIAGVRAGDRLLLLPGAETPLVVGGEELAAARDAVDAAMDAFGALQQVPDVAITAFFHHFADRLADDNCWRAIAAANADDVAAARSRGRSVTRLVVNHRMQAEMVAGLRAWAEMPSPRGRVLETVRHPGWRVEQFAAPLGVAAFVFEGRPNVFADATGVLRSGNTVVFRIGSDALGTARAIVGTALRPALSAARLPPDAVVLLDRAARAAGWALFSDPRLSLAVARGSGPAVAQLGAVARQAGVPVSLHGTGGAWLIADSSADADRFELAVRHSLDRKVCNTLNVCLIHRARATELVPRFLDSLEAAGRSRGHGTRLWVLDPNTLSEADRARRTVVRRAEGDREEPWAQCLDEADLGREWEWEETPEVTLGIVDGLADAIRLFNTHSPRFIASLCAEDAEAHELFQRGVDCPFVGTGFTRWVDGQYALHRPELGLSNWQHGRLLGRGGILSGDGLYTVRTRMIQDDPDLHR